MSNYNLNGIFGATKVDAYDMATDKKVGTYDSISRAGRALYIRSEDMIKRNLYAKDKGKGVANYKTNVCYYFKEVKS